MKLELQIVCVALGGAIGAVSRFGIAELGRKYLGDGFPFGTMVANLCGCLLIGVLVGSGQAEKSLALKLSFGVGFLGALTTFSTFGADTVHHINEGNLTVAFLNVLVNLVVGLGLVFLGISVAKRWL